MAGSEEVGLQYWLRWQVPLCALTFVIPAVVAVIVLRRARPVPLRSGDLWITCWKSLHPVWLLFFRAFAFLSMAFLLYQVASEAGIFAFFFYTQWTFVLVMVYFALGTIISAYGCWMFFRRPTPKIRETDKLLKGEDEGSKLTVTTKAKDGSDATKLQSYYSQIDQQNAGFWGYLMQLIYQTCAGAVIMTDIVFWCILVPTMSNKTITWLIGYMHSLNAFFLLLDTSINNLPFQWLGLAYFVLWTSVYGVFQWAVHICGVTWWPYPFLELSTPWAPLWYFGMAAVHVPFYGIYMLLIKAKFNICSRLFPDAFVRN